MIVRWDLDDRGNAVNLQISYAEIVRRGWHAKKSHRIPLIWRDTVQRVIREHHRQLEWMELRSRFGNSDAQRRVELRERVARADAATRARRREPKERYR